MVLLSIYLLLGLLLNFVGPLSHKIKKGFSKADWQKVRCSISEPERYNNLKLRVAAFKIFLSLLVVICYPLLYLVLAIDYFRRKKRLVR